MSTRTVNADQCHLAGTSSIVNEETHEPLLSTLTLIVETAVKLVKDGHKVVIVSSGAIGVGLQRMDVEKRPKHLPRIQVLPTMFKMSRVKLTVYWVGSRSSRPVSAHESMGQPIHSSTTTCCADTANPE